MTSDIELVQDSDTREKNGTFTIQYKANKQPKVSKIHCTVKILRIYLKNQKKRWPFKIGDISKEFGFRMLNGQTGPNLMACHVRVAAHESDL